MSQKFLRLCLIGGQLVTKGEGLGNSSLALLGVLHTASICLTKLEGG